MNERIKELMTEAGMLYTLDSKPTHIDENGTHTFQEINVYKNFDPEKFAELIVGECAETVEVYIHESLYNGLYERGYNDGRNASASLIKQHFGVEK